MARYVISDHHFGHANIIEYCDRPFDTVNEMDSTMLNRHYKRVNEDDVLIHLGDVAMDMRNGEETIDRFQRINGDLLVRGNHDVGLAPEAAPFPVVDACIITAEDYTFYCTHNPEEVPDDWVGWVLHGHIHNNDPEEFPFVAYNDQRVNVSADLLNFRPIALTTLTELLEACVPGDRLRDVTVAQKRFA